MAPADLDDRLRSAFALPTETGASAAGRAAIARALPAYRARRRARVVGVGGSALGALVLAVALVSVTSHHNPKITAAPPLRSVPAGPDCVEVAVGSAPLACEGAPAPAPTPAFSAANGAQLGSNEADKGSAATATATPLAPLLLGAGSRIEVSLPKIVGVAWTRVVIVPTGASTGSAVAVREVRTSGRTVAVFGPEPAGTYSVTALGVPTCNGKPACKAVAEQWSVALSVT